MRWGAYFLLVLFLIAGFDCSQSSNQNSSPDNLASSTSTLSATNNVAEWLPVTSDTLSATQLGYFENSSPWGGITELTANGLLLYVSETGFYYKNINDSDGRWQKVFLSNNGGYEGIADPGVGSAVADPANPDVIYFCSGANGLFGSNGNIDSFTYLDTGNIFRSVDNLVTHTMIAGQNSYWERLVLGCPGGGYARYIVETEPDPDIEMWVMANHGPLFAFDNRTTVTVNGEALSQKFYFMTHNKGLYQLTLSSDGSSMATATSIDMTPRIVDDGGWGTAYTGAGISEDLHKYQYAPQRSATDYRSTYLDDGTGNCNYNYLGVDVEGTSDGAGNCTENEIHGIGSVVILDPVYHAYNKSVGENTKAILWTGYFIQPVWPHGGLRRVVIDSSGSATATEITYTDLSTGSTISLDVRDIDCDEQQKTTLTSTGEQVSKYCYVAAGRNGVFKVTTDVDGSIDVAAINDSDGTFTFKTRDMYMTECAGISCSDTVSYQSADIDQEYIDGVSYLFLVTSSGVYYATDDFSGSVEWHDISGPGRSWGGAVDTANKTLYIGSNEELESLSLDHLTDTDLPWTGTGGFADRSGFRLAYDPDHQNWIHFTDLDGTYGYLKLDDDLNITESKYAGEVRTVGVGICYGMIYGDPNTLDADGNHHLDASYSGTVIRYNSYGDRVLFAEDLATGKNKIIISSNYYDGDDGAIHVCQWDENENLECVLATGDNSCTSKYWYWNSSENACVTVCDLSQSPNPLPTMSLGGLAVNPLDANEMYVIGYDGSTYHLYGTSDGGANWTNRDSWYVYGSSAGSSLQALGNNVDMVFDPQDGKSVYITYYGKYGIFKLDTDLGYVTNISNLDLSADDNASATTLGSYRGQSYTTLGDPKYYMPFSRNIDAVVDATTGKTRLYMAIQPFCDAGWGVWPETNCTTTNGGGLYTRLVDSDSTADASIAWTKLNYSSESLRYFMAYDFAVSPVDPNYIVVAGTNDFGWGSAGNPANLSAGIIYSKDGGSSWSSLTNETVNAKSASADPFDKNRFAAGLQGAGTWLLDLDTTDNLSIGSPEGTDDGGTADGGTMDNQGTSGETGGEEQGAGGTEAEESGEGASGWNWLLSGVGCSLNP